MVSEDLISVGGFEPGGIMRQGGGDEGVFKGVLSVLSPEVRNSDLDLVGGEGIPDFEFL